MKYQGRRNEDDRQVKMRAQGLQGQGVPGSRSVSRQKQMLGRRFLGLCPQAEDALGSRLSLQRVIFLEKFVSKLPFILRLKFIPVKNKVYIGPNRAINEAIRACRW